MQVTRRGRRLPVRVAWMPREAVSCAHATLEATISDHHLFLFETRCESILGARSIEGGELNERWNVSL
jgi:hypothetical protein